MKTEKWTYRCVHDIYPREKLKAEFYMLPPFVFVSMVVTVSTVVVKPPGFFKEDEWYVMVSLTFEEVGLEFFECTCGYSSIYVGGRPGTGLCASFPFSVFA